MILVSDMVRVRKGLEEEEKEEVGGDGRRRTEPERETTEGVGWL
jgi:hypothetical protein